jgi:hypothetical protein
MDNGTIEEAKSFLMDKHSIKISHTYYSFCLYMKIYNNKTREAKRFLKQFMNLTGLKNESHEKHYIGVLDYIGNCKIAYLKINLRDSDFIKTVARTAETIFNLIGEKFESDC